MGLSLTCHGRIVLASASPRRREFLEILGLKVEIIPSEIAEVGYGGDPSDVAHRMTRQKVRAVRSKLGAAFEGAILGADTIVAMDREIFGKPRDRADARRILGRLSGRSHEVHTAFLIETSHGETREGVVTTKVEMAKMSEAEIAWYAATGEPDDKAGAYAIQGIGGMFVRSIGGSYSNVVGLPLVEVIGGLKELGVVTLVS